MSNPIRGHIFEPTNLVVAVGGSIYHFDPTNFDDPATGSSYSYRVEDVGRLRTPTIRRIGLIYRDLGSVTLTFTLTGSNDSGQPVSASTTATFGGNADSKLYVKLVDLTLTAQLLQLSISRAAGGGPMALCSVSLIGEVEEVTL